MGELNYYDILEVPATASDADIQHAYRQLIQVWHPDRFQQNRELLRRAEQKTKLITEAFRHLSDPSLRARHDETLRQQHSQTVRSSPSPSDYSAPPPTDEVDIIACPNLNCGAGLRVPAKGRLRLSCPRCHTRFIFDTSLKQIWDVRDADKEGPGDSSRAQAHSPSDERGWSYRFGRYVGRNYTAYVPRGMNTILRRPLFWIIAGTALVVYVSIENTGLPPSELPTMQSSSAPSNETILPSVSAGVKAPELTVPVAPQKPTSIEAEVPIRPIEAKPRRHFTPPHLRQLDPVQPPSRMEAAFPGNPPVSLATGTRMGTYRIPAGHGQLRIINGTTHDAVVRLGEYDGQRRLWASIYLKGNDSITVEKIGPGSYRLAFVLGVGWNERTKRFDLNRRFEQFDEPFEFAERIEAQDVPTAEGIITRTTTSAAQWEVTLHTVPSGHAKTTSMNERSFDDLFQEAN